METQVKLNPYQTPPDEPHDPFTLAMFEREYQTLTRSGLIGLAISCLSGVAASIAMARLAARFDDLFRGEIGEVLLAVFFTLALVSPIILFSFWMHLKTTQAVFKCSNCDASFLKASRIMRVRKTGRCPACETLQFTGRGSR